MELLLELFATVVIAVLISFLIAKLVSLGGGDGGNDSTRSSELSETKNNDQENSSKGIDEIITRDSSYLEKFQTESCKNEKKAEFVQDFTQKVDHKFCGESIQEDLEHNREIECLVRDDVVEVDQKNIEIIGRGDGDDDDDDWEGIERSELEKMFAKAANFVEKSGDKEESLEMELYGLHKVATEGPCREQPPMPLKLAARAKWVESCYV